MPARFLGAVRGEKIAMIACSGGIGGAPADRLG